MENKYVKCVKINNDVGYWTLNKIYKLKNEYNITADTNYTFRIPYYALQNADFIEVTKYDYLMQENPTINSTNINRLITILKFINGKTI